MNIEKAFRRFIVRRIWGKYILWRNRDLLRNLSSYHNFDKVDLNNSFTSEVHQRTSDRPSALFRQSENSTTLPQSDHWEGGFYKHEEENPSNISLPLKSSDREQ